MNHNQQISVSIPSKFFRPSDIVSYPDFLRSAFETGVRSIDSRLWDEDSNQLFLDLQTTAEVFLGDRTPRQFSVSRRSYLKCVFMTKEYSLSFYDLSFWLVTHGAGSIHSKLPGTLPNMPRHVRLA